MDGRLRAGALALTLLMTLAGCGGGGGATPAPQDSAARSTGSAPTTASAEPSGDPVRMSLLDGNQTDPAIARLAAGGQVVAWVSQPGDTGADSRIVLQRYDEQGAAVGSAVEAAAPANAIVARPALAAAADGGFVVAWIQGDSAAGAYPGGPEPQVNFFVRRYAADGQPLGAAQQASTTASHYFTEIALAPLAGGGFAAGWLVDRGYSSDPMRQPQAWLRVYDASGAAAGEPVALRGAGSPPQQALALAPRAEGGFLVAWQQWLDPDHTGLYLRAFDAAAQPLAPEARVDAGEQPWPNAPALATLTGGRHVLAWDTGGTNDSAGRVRVRLLDGDGAPLGPPVAADSGALAWSSAPQVAALDDGGFAATWLAASLDARLFSRTVRGQRFDAQGQPSGQAFTLGSSSVDALVPGAACGCQAVAGAQGGGIAAAMQAYSPATAWDVWVGRN